MFKLITLFAILFTVSVSMACFVMPDNTYGIFLNDDESVDVTIINYLGEEGVNYYKTEENITLPEISDKIMYSYRGHSEPSVMVNIVLTKKDKSDIDYYSDFSNMVFFTVDEENLNMNEFDPVSFMRHELEWLLYYGIINFTILEINEIENSFYELYIRSNERDVKFSPMYYFTKQDTLLSSAHVLTENNEPVAVDCTVEKAVIKLPSKSLEFNVNVRDKKKGAASFEGNKTVSPLLSTKYVDLHGRTVSCNLIKRYNGKTGLAGIVFKWNKKTGKVSRILIRGN